MLFYEAALLSVTPNKGPKRLGNSDVETQLISLLVAHQDTGLDAPLREAQHLCRQMASRIGPGSDHVVRPSERILYADIQHASFLRTEDLATLHEAITCYERVTVLDPILSRRLALGHGSALATLYDEVPNPEHAKRAIELLKLVIIPDVDDELAALALCYLAPLTLESGWHGESRSAVTDDYTLRIDAMLKKPWRPYLQINLLLTRTALAGSLSARKRSQEAADDWLKFGRAVVNACPPEHFLLVQGHFRLASMYRWRFSFHGNPPDLEHAIHLANEGLELRSLTSYMRCMLLHIKSTCLGSQAKATGNLNLLEDAIKLSRELIALCPPKHRKYPAHVSGLMFLLGTHFESTGRIECLDEIISLADLDSVVNSQSFLACNIAAAMRDRAQLASVGTATALLQRAIGVLGARSQSSANLFTHEKTAICHELGAVYDLQAELGIGIDHDFRLQLARDAVEMGRDSFEGRTEATIGLVRALLHRASHAFNESLAEEAEDLIRDELKDDQLLDHLRASLTALQAELVVVRSGIQAIPIDLAVAWQMFETIVTDTSARPRDRLRIAIRWATLAEGIDAKSALLAYQHAVGVLPQVGYIGEDLMGRVQALRQARDLVPCAASFALGIGEVKQAVALLEHGRGVLWQQSLHLRPPLHLLPSDLASQLADISKTLDSSETNAFRRRQAAERFRSIILEIRSEPGHENFLLPRTYGQLAGGLPEGFVVWLIPSKHHCDIVIVDSRRRPQATHFRHVGLNLDQLKATATAFTQARACAWRSIDRNIRPVHFTQSHGPSKTHELLLRELWKSLVEKIVQKLGVPVRMVNI
jgi:hypothetical protein